MNHDPHYLAIVERLSGDLDRDVFEKAANILIQKDLPDLVPIPGGSDAGKDGTTSGEGPFLVATTSRSYRRNVRTNLASHSSAGNSQRLFVFATREKMSEAKRANLRVLAEELGYRVHHIYDREALAIRLYSNSAVCKELLGLTGRPPALTIVPPHPRPIPIDLLLAREEALEWLKSGTGDALLVGEPGSGKTFLLRSLATTGRGLFLADQDRTALANAIRDQKPSVIFVDDPFANVTSIGLLRQLREDLRAGFRIVSSSWPGDQEELASSLELPSSGIHHLSLLKRNEMVKLVQQLGILGPADFVGELVTQAAGKPGLAVTLTQLCFHGDVKDVISGTALRKSLGSRMEKLVGQTASYLLGTIAIGGEAGLDTASVSRILGRPLDEVATSVRLLAAGGVLRPSRFNGLTVSPPILRYALVRHVFFSGPGNLPYHQIANELPNQVSLVEVLIGAAFYGASVPDLRERVSGIDSTTTWLKYAQLGKAEARLALGHRPDLFKELTPTTLHSAPEITIPKLLSGLASMPSMTEKFYQHNPWQLDELSRWIKRANPNSPEPIARRQTLLTQFSRWAKSATKLGRASETLWLLLNPGFESREVDPGSGHQITYKNGILRQEDLRQFSKLWQTILSLIKAHIEEINWNPFFYLLYSWEEPSHLMFGKEAPQATVDSMHSIAREFLKDVAAITQHLPSVQTEVRSHSLSLGIEIATKTDRIYDTLFPEERHPQDWREAAKRETEAVAQLAKELSGRSPKEVIKLVLAAEKQASQIGRPYPRHTPILCKFLSEKHSDPTEWISELVARKSHPDLVEPFLKSASTLDEPRWKYLFQELLGSEYRRVVAMSVIALSDPPPDLLDEILGLLETSEASWIGTWCLRGEIPTPTLRRLLLHPVEPISTEAAIGEWMSEPHYSLRPDLESEWKMAISKARSKEHFLAKILPKFAEQSEQWLRGIISEESHLGLSSFEAIIEATASALSPAKQKKLIDLLRETCHHFTLAEKLVSYNTDVYRHLLDRSELKELHMAPLAGEISDGRWLALAEVAHEFGSTIEEIFFASEGKGFSFFGSESAKWLEDKNKLEVLTDSENLLLAEIASFGLTVLDARMERAKRREDEEDIFGR